MSTNLSKQKREDLLNKIEEIRKYLKSNLFNENARKLKGYLGELTAQINGQKYGLVFEEHKEAIDEKLENNLPVLTEEKELFVGNGGEMNFLIEGDNLASLQLLEKTHKGKIDVIYIDPPYNTGNKDFIYDDDFVDSADSFRHSKWCSFITKRLEVAKNLLKENGFIFISIDDNEQADLRVVCNEIFGEENFVANLPMIMNLKGNQDEYGFAGTHEYTLVYARNKTVGNLGLFKIDESDEEFSKWEEDEIGYFKKGANLKSTGVNAPREKRPNLFFPIYISNDGTFSVDEKIENSTELYPVTDGKEMSWRWSKEKFRNEKYNVIISEEDGKFSIYKKQRPELGDLPTKKAKSVFYKPEYSSGNGTAQLKEIFGEKIFNNPKPIDLIKDFLQLSTFNSQFSTVLDFFAGSGTTGHAVLKLNAEDGGKRKFILCTNNENGICRDITYQRLKTVITGERKDGSKYSDGLPGSLKYFKVDFVPVAEKEYYEYADKLLLHVRELVELENAVDFEHNNSVAIVLTDDEMTEFEKVISTSSTTTRTLYLGHDVLLSKEQKNLLTENGIEVKIIPQYYYPELNG